MKTMWKGSKGNYQFYKALFFKYEEDKEDVKWVTIVHGSASLLCKSVL